MVDKKVVIKELAKLESMNWASDPKVAERVFPYVLVEAISLLKNSELVENPVDYTSTGEKSKAMLDDILSK